ncbi:hypothetical protein FBU59_005250, partial [Linderina macrospora]
MQDLSKLDEIRTAVTNCLEANQEEVDDPVATLRGIGGGCINNAFEATTTSGKRYFVKAHMAEAQITKNQCLAMFEAELKGLVALKATNTVRVPTPIAVGELTHGAFLVTEYVHMRPLHDQRRMGEQLARLHSAVGSTKFGFEVDNSIGSTHQPNAWHDDWVEFLRMRLEFQFSLAKFSGHAAALCNELLKRLPEYFQMVTVTPALIHGDLWSGNCAADDSGEPVIFDPATYWGHHEAELGIMRMFGGFSQECFDAYHAIIPKTSGFNKRVLIYELYHAVNHYNLFGSGYLGQ